MNLENIAAQILINLGKYTNRVQALEGLKSEFKTHFPKQSYEEWNTEVPESFAENIISNVSKNGNVSVKFIIKDLEIICKTI